MFMDKIFLFSVNLANKFSGTWVCLSKYNYVDYVVFRTVGQFELLETLIKIMFMMRKESAAVLFLFLCWF